MNWARSTYEFATRQRAASWRAMFGTNWNAKFRADLAKSLGKSIVRKYGVEMGKAWMASPRQNIFLSMYQVDREYRAILGDIESLHLQLTIEKEKLKILKEIRTELLAERNALQNQRTLELARNEVIPDRGEGGRIQLTFSRPVTDVRVRLGEQLLAATGDATAFEAKFQADLPQGETLLHVEAKDRDSAKPLDSNVVTTARFVVADAPAGGATAASQWLGFEPGPDAGHRLRFGKAADEIAETPKIAVVPQPEAPEILPATVPALEAVPWQKLYGAWNISYEDQKHKGYAVIKSPGAMRGKTFYPNGEKGFVCNGLKLEGARLTGSYWPYFEQVNFELQLSGDGKTLSGQWMERSSKDRTPWREGQRTYDDPDNPERYTARGSETWTRAIPRIESITVIPLEYGALDYPKMQAAWKVASADYYLPKIALDVKGQNLPLHLETHYEYLDVKLDDPNLRFATHYREHLPVFEQRPENTVRLFIWLTKDARPGRKTLTINGAQVNWDLRFENYGGPVTKPPR
jgi:hypothetical protein